VLTGIPSSATATWTIAYQGTQTATAGAQYPVRCDEPATPGEPPQLPPTSRLGDPDDETLGVYATCATVRGNRYDLSFGYLNGGTAPIGVEVGSANRVSGGAAGQGQPTTFLPGQVDTAFAIVGIPRSASRTWTVKLPSGRTTSATGDATLPSCQTSGGTTRSGGTTTTSGTTTSGTGVRGTRRSRTTRANPPQIAVRVTPVKKRVRTGKPARASVRTTNKGTVTLYDVRIVVPTPNTRNKPTRVRPGKGVSCTVAGSAGASMVICRVAKLMPGESTTFRIDSTARGRGWDDFSGTAAGRSLSGTRVQAVDAAKAGSFGFRAPSVTG